MEQLVADALGSLSPEEQLRARNAMYQLNRSGFCLAFETVSGAAILGSCPRGDFVNAEQAGFLAGEAVKRGFILDFMERLTRLGVAPGERVIPKT